MIKAKLFVLTAIIFSMTIPLRHPTADCIQFSMQK